MSDTPVFNLEGAFAQLGGEESLFREMVAFFYSDGMQVSSEIEAAVQAGDIATTEKKAHRLRGTLLYLGAEPAVAAVARVETLARTGKLMEMAGALRSMAVELTRLADALHPYRPGTVAPK